MKKIIKFYGNTIELNLVPILYTKIDPYIRNEKLVKANSYIKKKHNGSYQYYYYKENASDGIPAGYYTRVFTIEDSQETLN